MATNLRGPTALEFSMSRLYSVGLWSIATLIALFLSLLLQDSALVDGAYLPRTNDSMYHARRILDAAVGTRGFYQFDERLHVPDGAWIPWPWAYDWSLAKLTQFALWIEPTLDPVKFISYAPVIWIPVNAALFLAVCRATGLSAELRLLAMLCFALSPLTQLLHAIGMVDHHYVEHTFVLATVWSGLRWLQQPPNAARAALLGVALGLSCAFHTALMLLQLVPLTAVFLLWLRNAAPPRASLRALCIALLLTTQIILLPSEPYRRLMFEFGLLSWFHFYVAVSTSAALFFMGAQPFSRRNLGLLCALCILLALPLGVQLVEGVGFLAGSFSVLDQIVEVRSPYKLFTEYLGPTETVSHYSWLLLATPLLLCFYAYRMFVERQPPRVYYAVAAVFGLALLLDQFRLHYFGFFAMVTGGLLLLDGLRARRNWHRGATFVAAFAFIALAYQPSLRERLFLIHAPSSDPDYANAAALNRELAKHCAEDPGVVLASTDDGNRILFNTECSVIANNFILRPEDARHIDEVFRLMRLTPAEIRQQRPDIKYVLLRVINFVEEKDGAVRLAENSPIAMELLKPLTPPPGYELLATIRMRMDDEGTTAVFARLFKILPDPEA